MPSSDRAVAELDRGAAGDDLAFVERQPAQRTDRHADVAGEARLYCVPMVCMWFSGRPDDDVVPGMPGTLTCFGCGVPFCTTCSTCAMTMPPLRFAAWAIEIDSLKMPRHSTVRLPFSSAVVRGSARRPIRLARGRTSCPSDSTRARRSPRWWPSWACRPRCADRRRSPGRPW